VPQLDLAALRTQLKTGKLAPIYLFVGEDAKLIDRMVEAVEAVVDSADRPFAVERLYAGDEGGLPPDIAAAARAFPMLGDRRIVFVLRAERLLKPKRAAKNAEIDEDAEAEEMGIDCAALEEYVAAPMPSNTVVFVASDVDRTRRFTKRLVEKAQVVVFSGLGSDGSSGRREAERLVEDELSRAGRTIDSRATQLLAERSGGDITKLRADIERLLLYTEGSPKIAAADVEETATAEVSVGDEWAVTNAIGDGDAPRALRETAARLDRGDSPHALVGQLRWWVSNRLAEGAPARVADALNALLRTDLALKSSGGDERMLVERLVAELTGKPVPRKGWRY
jgi:DNA polymerase-3 subunit delta